MPKKKNKKKKFADKNRKQYFLIFYKKFSMYWSHLSVVKQNQINSYIWY